MNGLTNGLALLQKSLIDWTQSLNILDICTCHYKCTVHRSPLQVHLKRIPIVSHVPHLHRSILTANDQTRDTRYLRPIDRTDVVLRELNHCSTLPRYDVPQSYRLVIADRSN